MRKNNEGYVLPFVLVVMIVLTIIATSLMTAALNNLQSQQRFTERMVDKYAAEGEIEKIVAVLSEKKQFTELTIEKASAVPDLTPEEKKTELQLAVGAKLEELLRDTASYEVCKPDENGIVTFTVDLKASAGTSEIASIIQCSGKVTESSTQSEGKTILTYSIEELQLTYNSYEISTKEVSAE